ncbi:mannitol dehydrogenase family protein [Alicyclobacillus cycloheptanicus]|uniref:Fructuronate reductase n=1 Tax=Alicyclobacillus cycloheptanicus TaxID=1457 RepID=A0ABT9XHL2_9BACL|nr:mannitol dehydrogenase family protein [Alicyclobacillus cycloheptanicus]MDQ0189778.1 fructuronate reductase [Alicyclobacillus cycloheptanicus]WDM01981.1 mannitol dehydrogenase family protein [Alicyclobacillus cycloheptanicus]
MLELNKRALQRISDWQRAGIECPTFDVETMTDSTRSHPVWVHIGGGNIFRGFIAVLQQQLLSEGRADTGIVVVSPYDTDIIDRVYRPHDNLSLLVLMHPDGTLEKKLVASVAESLVGDPARSADWARLNQIFAEPSLQMVSFTITEKGYDLTEWSGELSPDVQHDVEQGPAQPRSTMAKVTALAYTRYLAGALPIAFVSMDNCAGNGDRLRSALVTIAHHWAERGWVDAAFVDYLTHPDKVSFPWSMIDKITPRPAGFVRDALTSSGVAGMDILQTRKNTFIAPFVNAEVPQYLVVEDHFPNGRPPLEHAGVLFTDRATVEKVERMKVTTCLNPLHTALAVFGCLLGYSSIADEMKDARLRALVTRLGYDEGLPVAPETDVLPPRAFLAEVLQRRLPNPYIPDTPQRIATDTSQKIAIRFGETIKAYAASTHLDVTALRWIPLVIAGWCRYLLGVDDQGERMQLSPDPMLEELTSALSGIRFGEPDSAAGRLRPILSNSKLFGVNLYEMGLGAKIEGYFQEMTAGKHAVRDTLAKYVAE